MDINTCFWLGRELHNTSWYWLQWQWQQDCEAIGIKHEQRQQAWDIWKTAHTAPARHYHHASHISSLLRLAMLLESSIEGAWQDIKAVRWAIWWHDFVYEIQSKTNEQDSAKFAVDWLHTTPTGGHLADAVQTLILATAGHQPTNDHADTALFLDIDLAILASNEQLYKHYIELVKLEYTTVYSLTQYATGRSQFLKTFIQRPRLFATPIFQPYEAQARANLAIELRMWKNFT